MTEKENPYRDGKSAPYQHENKNGRCKMCGHVWPCIFAIIEDDNND